MTKTTNRPMYQQIKDDLLTQIRTGRLSPGDRLPTEQEFMQQYHVSRITVSKALGELKNEGIIERFPNRGSFVSEPRSALALPVMSETEMFPPEKESAYIERRDLLPEIACIIPSLKDTFSLSMINGVLSAFPESRYICHIFQSQNPQIENYLLKRCLETKIAGIVLFPQDQPFFSDELLFMNLQKYPLILLDRYLPHLNTNYVIADNKMSGKLCMEHLHALGHRHIAFATSSDRSTFSIQYRLEGMLDAADNLNLPADSVHMIDNLDVTHPFHEYRDLFVNLFSQDNVTALIAAECHTCTYLYNLCTWLQVHIPEEISLISFDKPMEGSRNPDFFTHINQSEYLMGQEAGSLLRRRLEEHDMNIYHKVITPTLEIRHSTAMRLSKASDEKKTGSDG